MARSFMMFKKFVSRFEVHVLRVYFATCPAFKGFNCFVTGKFQLTGLSGGMAVVSL